MKGSADDRALRTFVGSIAGIAIMMLFCGGVGAGLWFLQWLEHKDKRFKAEVEMMRCECKEKH